MESLSPALSLQNMSLKESLEIFISCRSLKNLDALSKSDPYVIIKMKEPSSKEWIPIGKTQTKKNTNDPDFAQSITIEFYFERTQNILFEVYDQDQESKSQFIGKAQTVVGKIAGARLQTYITQVVDLANKKVGSIILRAEAVKESSDVIDFDIQGVKIENVEVYSKSDGFLIFKRAREALGDQSVEYVKTYQTEYIKDNLNPHWKQFQISFQRICNSNPFLPLCIELWDWNKSGKHKFIASIATLNLNSLLQLDGGVQLELINKEKKLKKKKYVNSGMLKFNVVKSIHRPSFVEYLRSGWAITLNAAIDFTASNGDPKQKSSLHYTGGMIEGKLNQYEEAIWQLGTILQHYDYDKKFPVYGFGGQPSYSSKALHCFSLAPHGEEVYGAQGILDIYRQSIHVTQLSGPTLFSGILKNCEDSIKKLENAYQYHVLLILTDGKIMDMDSTKEQIVRMSKLPLSIIIVGVGNADFQNMEQLDADSHQLVDLKGNRAERDIVQFVEFNKFKGNGILLADQVLKEVPQQIVSYMENNNIQPHILSHNMDF